MSTETFEQRALRFAREVGLYQKETTYLAYSDEIERFATLIAAAIRDELAKGA